MSSLSSPARPGVLARRPLYALALPLFCRRAVAQTGHVLSGTR